jgi:hypothetical protein
MGGYWLTGVARALFLLAFMVGVQGLTLPIKSMPAVETGPVLVASDCTGCDMVGVSAGVCHGTCTPPLSALDSAVFADTAVSAASYAPSEGIAPTGRVVRPSLAPPRFS